MTGQADFQTIHGRGQGAGGWLARWITLFLLCQRALAADNSVFWPPLPDRLEAARTALATAPTNAAAAVVLARTCFEASRASKQDAEKSRLAEEGIATAQAALALHPQEAGLEYYLGLNLGQLASTRGMSALKLVREMETHVLAARKIDASFSDAGPDRTLGYLYLNAPGWPLSVGSNDKARAHFESALKLAPLFPEHYLALAEACLKWKKSTEAANLVAKAEEIWPKAREKFTGGPWEGDWVDWEKRLAALQKKLKHP